MKHSPDEMVKLGFSVAQAYQSKTIETLSADDLTNAKRHRLFAETILELMKKCDELLAALDDAATSLETIQLRSFGIDSYLDSKEQMRSYAGTRAKVARDEIVKFYGQPEKQPEIEKATPAIIFFPAGSLGEEVTP